MTKHITVAEYEAAITASHGLLAGAARRLGCSRTAVDKAVKRHPTLQHAVDAARAEILDLAESRLYEAINAGHKPTITFFLSTIGKDRGYVTRTESAEYQGKTLKELEAMSDDEFNAYRDELERKYNYN